MIDVDTIKKALRIMIYVLYYHAMRGDSEAGNLLLCVFELVSPVLGMRPSCLQDLERQIPQGGKIQKSLLALIYEENEEE
jgi:hypothetical protein